MRVDAHREERSPIYMYAKWRGRSYTATLRVGHLATATWRELGWEDLSRNTFQPRRKLRPWLRGSGSEPLSLRPQTSSLPMQRHPLRSGAMIVEVSTAKYSEARAALYGPIYDRIFHQGLLRTVTSKSTRAGCEAGNLPRAWGFSDNNHGNYERLSSATQTPPGGDSNAVGE